MSLTATIDWGKVLLEAGVDVPSDRDEFSILCPFHKDNVASCSINIEKGLWICFAGCGQGSLKGFLKQLLGFSNKEVDKFLSETEYTLDLDFFEQYQQTENFLPEVELPEDVLYDQYPKWIFDRGFTREVLEKWECGTNAYGDLIIPIKDGDARLVGWVSRRRSAIPKYMYSKGLKKSKIVLSKYPP